MFWFGAIVSLCYIPGLTGAYILTQWPLLAVVLPFALLRPGPFTVFHLLGAVFIAYAAVLLPFSAAPIAGVFGLWLLVIVGLTVWFGTTLVNTRELYAGLAAGAAVSSFVGVLQYLGFYIVPGTSAMPPGLYANAVQQGTVLALIAVALATERMWFWTLPLLPGILLANSRGGFIVLAVGLLGCGVRRLWVFSALAAVAVFYLLSPLSSSDAQRVFIWHTAYDNLTWLGWGAGVFYIILLSQDGVTSFFPEYAHNDFLQLAFEYGLAAVLPFIVLGYAIWRTDVKEWPIVLAFCTAACFSMPLFMPIAAFLAFVAVGRVLRVHGLDGSHGRYSGRDFLSWVRGCFSSGGKNLSVASHHPAKG